MPIETESATSAPDDVTLAPAQPDLVEDAEATSPSEETPAEEKAPPEPFLCAVSADLFRRAFLAASKEEHRHYLMGVHIEPCDAGGAMLSATDGHIAVIVHDPDAYVKGRAIIRLNKLMLRACKAERGDLTGTERVLMINCAEDLLDTAMIAHVPYADSDTSRDHAFGLIDEPSEQVIASEYGDFRINETYPRLDAIIPRDMQPGYSGVALNALQLKPIIEALKPAVGKACPIAVFTAEQSPEASAILVKPGRTTTLLNGRALEAMAIIMPIRIDTEAGPADWAPNAPDRRVFLADLEDRDLVVADDGFTCLSRGVHTVHDDPDMTIGTCSLYIECADGKHYLDCQLNDDGSLAGLSRYFGPIGVKPGQPVRKVEPSA
ncbi:MAG: hypothetical protein NVV72_01220 [Asticcacaulis sp.]|nr:hypothetical protein [Asticcacaulis sp.]